MFRFDLENLRMKEQQQILLEALQQVLFRSQVKKGIGIFTQYAAHKRNQDLEESSREGFVIHQAGGSFLITRLKIK